MRIITATNTDPEGHANIGKTWDPWGPAYVGPTFHTAYLPEEIAATIFTGDEDDHRRYGASVLYESDQEETLEAIIAASRIRFAIRFVDG